MRASECGKNSNRIELSAHFDARRAMSARDDGADGGAGDDAFHARALHPPFESFAYTATERAVVGVGAPSKSSKDYDDDDDGSLSDPASDDIDDDDDAMSDDASATSSDEDEDAEEYAKVAAAGARDARPTRRAAAATVASFKEIDSDDDADLMTSCDEGDMDVDAGEDDEDKDVVEKIVYCRPTEDAGLEFCVKWEGVSYRRCSWETAETLNVEAPHKLTAFMRKHERVEAQDVPFAEHYTVVDRVVAHREGEEEGSTEFLVKWCGLGYAAATWEAEASLNSDADRACLARYHRFSAPKAMDIKEMPRGRPEPPTFKNNMALREYQVTSFEWMINNYCRGRNVILGDEMGLGKTAQCISVMEYARTKLLRRRQPMCVVAPLTTLGHWKREMEKWTDMNVIVYDGSGADRELCAEHEFYVQGTRSVKFDVMLVSFENVRRNTELFEQFSWAMVVVDEAHKLKDINSQTTASVTALRYDWLLLLTGTPIQNNIKELFGMLHILDPRQFDSWEDFQDEYCDASGDVDAEQVLRLREVLKLRMLRRMKEDVEKIPAKEEVVVWVELTAQQRAYYRALYENQIHVLLEGQKVKSVPQLRNLSMELRKICNHPFLCDGLEQDYTDKRLAAAAEKGETAPTPLQLLTEGSGKMGLLSKLLAKLKRDGHKVLIFSQFTTVLDLIQDFMNASGYETERLDGSTSAENRQAGIDRFNTEGQGFVYLLSTRAGGMGITLTSADTAIIFDSDWNPQNDLQAMARCHRIGQTKEVKVYRFITKDTYEQSLFETAARKYGLDEAVLGGGDTDDVQSKKSAKEQAQKINELLKYGVHGALKDTSGEEASAFAAEDIDQILSRRAEHREVGPRAGNSFSVATFGGGGGGDGDDEAFWENAFGADAIEAAKQKASAPVIDKRFAVEGPRKRRKVNYKEVHAIVQNTQQSPNANARVSRMTYNERRAEAKRRREEEKKMSREAREAARAAAKEAAEKAKEELRNNWTNNDVWAVIDALGAFGAPNGDTRRAVINGCDHVDRPLDQKFAVAKTLLEMFAVIDKCRAGNTSEKKEASEKDNDEDADEGANDKDEGDDDSEDSEETKLAMEKAMEEILVPAVAANALGSRVLWQKLRRGAPRRAQRMKERDALAKLIEVVEIDIDDDAGDDKDKQTIKMEGIPREKSEFTLPVLGPKVSIPAEWWTAEDDEHLLRGSLRYGFTPGFARDLQSQLDCIRHDKTLRFAVRTGVFDDGEYHEVREWPDVAPLKTRLTRLLAAMLRPPKKPSKAEIIAARKKAAADAALKRDMEALRRWQEQVRMRRQSTSPLKEEHENVQKRSPLKPVAANARPMHAPAPSKTTQQSLFSFFGDKASAQRPHQ